MAKIKHTSNRERLRRRRQRDKSKLVLGGTKVKRRIRSTDRISTGASSTAGSQKRSAATIAAATGAQDLSQRQLPPKNKRKRTLSHESRNGHIRLHLCCLQPQTLSDFGSKADSVPLLLTLRSLCLATLSKILKTAHTSHHVFECPFLFR